MIVALSQPGAVSPNFGTQQSGGDPSHGVAEWSKRSEDPVNGRPIKCEYETYCTQQPQWATDPRALRIRRLGVRVPPSALQDVDPA